MNISYTTHKGGNAIYVDMSKREKKIVLELLTEGLLDTLERSNYDNDMRNALQHQDSAFCKQTQVSNKFNNSMASFIAGILAQHRANSDRHFSIKTLKGITLVSRFFNQYLDNKYEVIEFESLNKQTPLTNTPFDQLIDRS